MAVVAALLTTVVAATTPAPPLTWVLAGGSLDAAGDEVALDATAPVDTSLTAGEDGAVLRADGARVDLAPGSVVELRGGVGAIAQAIALRSGSLLADVEVTLSVDATVATATGFGGAFRVERDATPRVATYDAAVGIAGDTAVSMTRLSQVPLGGPQSAVGPIVLDAADPWDARHADGALAIDASLADLATGLRATYGGAPQTAEFYRDFVGVTEGLVEALPQLAPTDLGRRFGPPAETLVAATAVTALVEGTGRGVDEVVAEALQSRAAGGTWGVVLARNDLDAAYVREVADAALRRRAEQGDDAEPVLPDPAPPATTPAGSDEPSAPSGDAPDPQPQPPSDTDPDPGPEPDPDPDPDPDPSPEPGPLEDPVGTVEDLLDPDGDGASSLDGTVEDLLEGSASLLGGWTVVPWRWLAG